MTLVYICDPDPWPCEATEDSRKWEELCGVPVVRLRYSEQEFYDGNGVCSFPEAFLLIVHRATPSQVGRLKNILAEKPKGFVLFVSGGSPSADAFDGRMYSRELSVAKPWDAAFSACFGRFHADLVQRGTPNWSLIEPDSGDIPIALAILCQCCVTVCGKDYEKQREKGDLDAVLSRDWWSAPFRKAGRLSGLVRFASRANAPQSADADALHQLCEWIGGAHETDIGNPARLERLCQLAVSALRELQKRARRP